MDFRSLPRVDDAAVLLLLAPDDTTPIADGVRQAIYLQLRVRIREHVRRAGLVIEAIMEDCVDRTMARALTEFSANLTVDPRFADGALAWLFSLALDEAGHMVRAADHALVVNALNNQAGELAAALQPEPDDQSVVRSSTRLLGIYQCVRIAISNYLCINRKTVRSESLAMYLRFTFAGMRQKDLARLYDRTPPAVNQRLSQTRRELRGVVAHCFEKDK